MKKEIILDAILVTTSFFKKDLIMITSIRKSRQKVIGLKTFFVYESLDVTTKSDAYFIFKNKEDVKQQKV